MRLRRSFEIRGIVQGVGFRPAVHRFATLEARERDGLLEIDWTPAVRRLAELSPGEAADSATWGVRIPSCRCSCSPRHGRLRASCTGLRRVGLSGGVFMNRLLDTWVAESLAQRGFEVLTHRELPPNDGGIAAGQAVVAGWQEN